MGDEPPGSLQCGGQHRVETHINVGGGTSEVYSDDRNMNKERKGGWLAPLSRL
jgi:hypothetical protein